MHHATAMPLHGGRAPRWLFHRMARLAGAISEVIIDDLGPDEMVRRLADPNWFQALSCAIGYDWHSSGTTTVTVAAVREALNDSGEVFVAGGKGKAGMKTPEDIARGVDLLSIPAQAGDFKEKSRLAAKTDSALIYDGIGIYHHAFIFSRSKKWAVVQQGMFKDNGTSVRFQWFSDEVDELDMFNEPHSGLGSSVRLTTLDLTSTDNSWARQPPSEAIDQYMRIMEHGYPDRHHIIPEIDLSARAREAIRRADDLDPSDYRELVLTKGVGRSTLRSLAFVSSLIYGRELAYRDPVAYAYNLGGKDRIPFEINRGVYDSIAESLEQIIDASRLDSGEKYGALRRLSKVMERSATANNTAAK